jgi:GT2 family glycosyltransferase
LAETEVTVVVPTLKADESLVRCVYSLLGQTWPNLDIVVVDNSGKGLVQQSEVGKLPVRILQLERNYGYGGAVNRGWLTSQASYLATINDDAEATPGWIEALTRTLQQFPQAGSVASLVLFDQQQIDSAGMLIARDGSSKQRGHRQSPAEFMVAAEVLCPSGSASMYRRTMLEQVGMFDEEFFAYCEDTDLGLRAARAGWQCRFDPQAVVYHGYSHSAGKASRFKAYHVERNRLFLALKNFPWAWLVRAPLYAVRRYLWHLWFLFFGKGAAAEFHKDGGNGLYLVYLVFRAHLSALFRTPDLWRRRQRNLNEARLADEQFLQHLERFEISVKQVAEL